MVYAGPIIFTFKALPLDVLSTYLARCKKMKKRDHLQHNLPYTSKSGHPIKQTRVQNYHHHISFCMRCRTVSDVTQENWYAWLVPWCPMDYIIIGVCATPAAHARVSSSTRHNLPLKSNIVPHSYNWPIEIGQPSLISLHFFGASKHSNLSDHNQWRNRVSIFHYSCFKAFGEL